MKLSNLEANDYIFFVASLAPYNKKVYEKQTTAALKEWQKGKKAKYIIGYFKVQGVYLSRSQENKIYKRNPIGKKFDIETQLDRNTRKRLRRNPHFEWGDDFLAVVGYSSVGGLLKKSFQITTCQDFRPNKNGKRLFSSVFNRGFKVLQDDNVINRLLRKLGSGLPSG